MVASNLRRRIDGHSHGVSPVRAGAALVRPSVRVPAGLAAALPRRRGRECPWETLALVGLAVMSIRPAWLTVKQCRGLTVRGSKAAGQVSAPFRSLQHRSPPPKSGNQIPLNLGPLLTRSDPSPFGKPVANELPVIFRCRWHFSPVTPVVAEPTSSNDIFESVFATIISRTKVFRSASRWTLVRGRQHGAATVPTFSVLAVAGLIAQFAEFRHGTSKIVDDPESCRNPQRRPCTRPLLAGNGRGYKPDPDMCRIRISMGLATRKRAEGVSAMRAITAVQAVVATSRERPVCSPSLARI